MKCHWENVIKTHMNRKKTVKMSLFLTKIETSCYKKKHWVLKIHKKITKSSYKQNVTFSQAFHVTKQVDNILRRRFIWYIEYIFTLKRDTIVKDLWPQRVTGWMVALMDTLEMLFINRWWWWNIQEYLIVFKLRFYPDNYSF